MARYTGPKEKLERRLGVKLFLKGERSLSPKSATVRKPYPPGMHGKNQFKKVSEFGAQLSAKQKIKFTYRMMEKQFKSYAKAAIESKDETGNALVQKLEQRLDNTVYKAGLAQSRDQARQLVTHGHILVNGVKTNIPSFQVKKNDEIKVRPGSAKGKYFTTYITDWFKKAQSPDWLEVNRDTVLIKVLRSPTFADSGLAFKDIQSIIEYYSR